jgi:hypothetical protein
MDLADLAPVDEDETYVKHLSLVVLGWVAITFFVALLMAAVIVFAT